MDNFFLQKFLNLIKDRLCKASFSLAKSVLNACLAKAV